MNFKFEKRDGIDGVVYDEFPGSWRPASLDEVAMAAQIRILENEVSDLRGFIDGMKRHVLAAAEMYGAAPTVDDHA